MEVERQKRRELSSRTSVCTNQRLMETEMFDVSVGYIQCECCSQGTTHSTRNHAIYPSLTHSLITSRRRTSVSAPLKLSLSQPITAQLSTQQSNSCSVQLSSFHVYSFSPVCGIRWTGRLKGTRLFQYRN